MRPCAIKQGLFLVRACGQRAVETCPSCGKPHCQQHAKPLGNRTLCTGCYAKEDTEDDTSILWYHERHRMMDDEDDGLLYFSEDGTAFDNEDLSGFESGPEGDWGDDLTVDDPFDS